MTIETTVIITTCVAAGIIGAIGAVIKHISNERKHPDIDKIIFKDVCVEKMKGQEDCVEAEIKGLKENVDKLEKTTSAGFLEIRNLIMQK